jgi:signal transduction histidine kinase
MSRLVRELAAAARRHPRRVDAAVAALLAALVIEEVLFSDVSGPTAALVPVTLLATLPLAWRRTAPVAAATIAVAAYAAMRLLVESEQEPQTPLIPLLLAAYSVGAHCSRRPAIAGLAVLWAGLIVIEPGDFIVLGPVFAGTWTAGRLVRSRESDARRLQELSEALERERVEEARIAAAEERARIARELHDVVSHSMSTIVLQAGAERVNLPEAQTSTHDTLRSIERTGREALAEMRRMVGVLRAGDEAGLAPQPGLSQLDDLAERVRRAGLPVDVRTEGTPVELAPGLDISAYRIVQEALTNALKHAGEARASVVVTYGAASLEIEVADDGQGGSGNGGGHGLTGLRERVAVFGGTLETGGREGGGFLVRARLPLERTAT